MCCIDCKESWKYTLEKEKFFKEIRDKKLKNIYKLCL